MMKKILIYVILSLNLITVFRAQNYKLGDLVYNSNDGTHGVVFWVSPDDRYGWMVAMTDMEVVSVTPVKKKFTWWSDAGVNIPGVPDFKSPHGSIDPAGTRSRAHYDTSGYEHTRALINAHSSSDINCVWHYVDIENGWFVPSAGQAYFFSMCSIFLDSTLIKNGGKMVAGSYYWTSSEFDSDIAGCFYPAGMIVHSFLKSDAWSVRLIRHFFNTIIEDEMGDTTLTIAWNTLEKSLQIEVQPTQNTVYSATITTAAGCERTVNKQIYVDSPDLQELYDTLCVGNPYVQNGFSISPDRTLIPGDHIMDTLLLAGTCQVPLRLFLHLKDTASSRVDTALCTGGSFIANGIVYADTGYYIQRLSSFNSCDSIIRIALSRQPNYHVHFSAKDTVYHSWNGIDYMATGTYQQRFKAQNGCDSLVTMDLIIVDVFPDTLYRVDTIYDTLGACQGTLPIVYKGQSLANYGSHELIPNDSTLVFIELKSYPIYSAFLSLDSCQRVSLNAHNYIRDTNVRIVYRSIHGCDSVFLVDINVRNHSSNHSFIDSCDRIVYEGDAYLRDTLIQRIFLNAEGCDSTQHIRMTVMKGVDQTLAIQSCDSVFYRGQWYYDSIQRIDHLQGITCEEIITANLYVGRSNHVSLSFDFCDSLKFENDFYMRDTLFYRQSLNRASCDSITEIKIRIRKSTSSFLTLDACDYVDYEGQRYVRDTVLYTTTINSVLCDSLHQVSIRIRKKSEFNMRIDSLFRVTYNDESYYFDTVLETLYLNADGCDSVHRVALYIDRAEIDSSQIVVYWGKVLALSNPSNSEILKTAHYEWYRDGQSLVSNRSYVEVGLPIPAGTYRVVARWAGGVLIRERRFEAEPSRAVYPNPANKGETLTLEMAKPIRGVEVYHVDGRLLFQIPKLSHLSSRFEAPMVAGAYILLVYFEDKTTETHKFIVR